MPKPGPLSALVRVNNHSLELANATGVPVTVFANDMASLFGGGMKGWAFVWGFIMLVLIPWSLYDIWKAGREDWHDITVERDHG